MWTYTVAVTAHTSKEFMAVLFIWGHIHTNAEKNVNILIIYWKLSHFYTWNVCYPLWNPFTDWNFTTPHINNLYSTNTWRWSIDTQYFVSTYWKVALNVWSGSLQLTKISIHLFFFLWKARKQWNLKLQRLDYQLISQLTGNESATILIIDRCFKFLHQTSSICLKTN